MDIREALLAEHSRLQTMKVVGYIDGDADRFAELVRLFLGDEYRVSQRAAAAVGYCVEHRHELVRPSFGKFVAQLEHTDAHPAIRRNILRLLQFVEIPIGFRAKAYDACIGLIDDPNEPVAVRAFAMTVAANIAREHPDLMRELRSIVNAHLGNTTLAFRVRARTILA
ncbi:MAG: hypothetical protein IPP63_02640 [Chloracidobacterium sp.]|nr:hypothetical protein [Chloracidobacterium sp.]